MTDYSSALAADRLAPSHYHRLYLLIAAATVVVYYALYFNVLQTADISLSQTRAYMALTMSMPLTWLMLYFMPEMFPKKNLNMGILAVTVLIFLGAVSMERSQSTVGDMSYLRSMIPNHSENILASERANLSDPRVKDLATRMAIAQREEMGEMKALLADLKQHGHAAAGTTPASSEPTPAVTP